MVFGLPRNSAAQSPLSGSELSMDIAVKNSGVIFVGTVKALGEPDIGPFGEDRYSGIEVANTTTLMGKLPARYVVGVGTKLFKKPPESPPMIGRSYLFFGKVQSDGVSIFAHKVMVADETTLDNIKRLLKSRAGIESR